MKIVKKITLGFFITGLVLITLCILLARTNTHPMILYLLIPLMVGCLGYLFSNHLMQSVHRLMRALKIVRSGNLEYRVATDSEDEIGILSMSIDHIVEDLRKATLEIRNLKKKSANFQSEEKALKVKEEYFQQLFQYSNDAVFICDFDGNIIDANEKACDMLEYSKDELLKIPFLELQTEDELSKSKVASKTSRDTGSVRFESVFKKSDGSLIDVEINTSIVDIQKGIMQSIVSDITGRKEMERSLRDSEEKFRTFMETASDLMFITDVEGRFIYVNDAMANKLAYLKEELIGMDFQDIVDKDTLEASRIQREQLQEAGENIHKIIWETKNRKKINGEMKAVAIFNSEGEFQGIRGIFRDITERKKIEESQRLTQLGRLAADMAHEVNNQISIISSRSEISLMRKFEDEELKRDIQLIKKQCDQIKDIVKRLLLFSKPSKGDFKEVDINQVIDFVIELVEKQFSYNQIQIIRDYTPSIPFVRINEKQIQEVLMNLLRNAYEAIKKGGTITISTSASSNHVQIDVTDTGSGISESDIKNIFDPFFTTKRHGTGLGLSVCYGIISAHDGQLTYKSKPGEGTSATIHLPIPVTSGEE